VTTSQVNNIATEDWAVTPNGTPEKLVVRLENKKIGSQSKKRYQRTNKDTPGGGGTY